jgi:toxin ParE1/3/4
MKVIWSNRALRSLAAIHERVSAESEEAMAHRVIDRILQRGDQLAAFPFSGRIVERYQRPGIRELIESPYRIVYRVTGQQIQIVDVFHSAQLPPWER